MKLLIATLFLFAFAFNGIAQSADSVFVEVGSGRSKFVFHEVKKGQTLYSIHKQYNVPISDIGHYNRTIHSTPLAVGQVLKLPLSEEQVVFEQPSGRSIPFYVKVKPGFTLFSLSRKYFNTSLDAVRAKNALTSDVLSTGQVLFVGYVDLEVARKPRGLSELKEVYHWESHKYKRIYDTVAQQQQVLSVKGPVTWNENAGANQVYVLFNGAPVGSVVKVVNNLTRRILYARVLGTIPGGLYKRSDLAVLSKKSAELLGVINERFYATVSYVK